MNKINFENLPSTNTPLSAENMNLLQTNVENAIAVNTTSIGSINTELGRIGTQKQAFGDIYTSDGTYQVTLYSNLVATYIGNSIWKIDFNGRIAMPNNVSANYYSYGISISQINSLLNMNLESVVSTEQVDLKSNYYFYNTSGELDMAKVGYGTVLEYHGDLNRLMPARIYTTTGSIGGWGLDKFSNDGLFIGTIYLKEQE